MSRLLLDRILEQSHDHLLLLDRDGAPVWATSGMGGSDGVHDATRRLRALVHPDDLPATERVVGAAVASRGAQGTVECRIAAGRGGWRWVEIICRNLVDDPIVQGTILTVRDVTERRAAEQALAEQAVLHGFLTANSSEVMIRVAADHHVEYVSHAVTPMLGLEPEELLGIDVALLVAAADRPEFLAAVRAADDTGAPAQVDVRVEGLTSEIARWVTATVRAVNELDGSTSYHVVLRDVAEQRAAEQALAEERELLATTLSTIRAGVLCVDAAGLVTVVNDMFVEITGHRPEIGSHVDDLAHACHLVRDEPEGDAILPPLRALRGESVHEEAARLVTPAGDVLDVVVSATPLGGTDEAVRGAVVTLHDVTALRTAERQLRQLATTDVLTSLPNRRHLETALDEALARHRRHPDRLAVVFIDLDGFKLVNDRLGHDAGDELLVQVATRLSSSVRAGDLVARLGGDEFVVLAEDVDGPADGAALARRLSDTFDDPFDVDGEVVSIGCSLGLADGNGVSAAAVLAEADGRMYEQKRRRHASTRISA